MNSINGSNPMLREGVFKRVIFSENTMSVSGTINKLMILLMLFITAAGISWCFFPLFDLTVLGFFTLLAFVLGIFTSFKPNVSPITTPIYVILEGLAIGFLSYLLDMEYNGIVLQAILLTIAVFTIMLVIYKFRIIKVDSEFTKWITLITGSIALVYLIDLVLMLFGLNVPFIHSNGWVGILISLFVVGVAAFNFLSDFYFIEEAANRQAPKYMEWYLSFGVFLTLVWVYLEILKLLTKLNSRRK